MSPERWANVDRNQIENANILPLTLVQNIADDKALVFIRPELDESAPEALIV